MKMASETKLTEFTDMEMKFIYQLVDKELAFTVGPQQPSDIGRVMLEMVEWEREKIADDYFDYEKEADKKQDLAIADEILKKLAFVKE